MGPSAKRPRQRLELEVPTQTKAHCPLRTHGMDDSYLCGQGFSLRQQWCFPPFLSTPRSDHCSLSTFYEAGSVPGAGGWTRPHLALKDLSVYRGKTLRDYTIGGKWWPRNEHRVLWEPSEEEPKATGAQGRLRTGADT